MTTAKRGEIFRSVLATGRLIPWETVEVSSQVSGLVTAVFADFNSIVRKGDLLAEIDPSTFQQKLRQAAADLSAAQANHKVVHLDVVRQAELLKRGLVTQQEYDHINAELQQVTAILLSREAAVENVKLDLKRCLIVSPADGVVLYKAIEVGRTIAASMTAPTLFVIAQDLRKMKILAPLNEVDVWHVKPDQEVRFSIEAIRSREFAGKVFQIRNPYVLAENKTAVSSTPPPAVTFECVIEVDNDDLTLRPGISAIVSIIIASEISTICIPNSALTVRPMVPALPEFKKLQTGEAVIYKLQKHSNIPIPTIISIGISDGINTAVRKGVGEGDSIVISWK